MPDHRTCWFTEEPVEPGPLYALPLITLSTALMAGVVLGIARHALDAVEELAAVKTPARAQTVLREDPVAGHTSGRPRGYSGPGKPSCTRPWGRRGTKCAAEDASAGSSTACCGWPGHRR